MRGQKLLKRAGLLHIRHHFIFRAIRYQAVQLIAALLHLIKLVEGTCQNILNRHAGCEMGMLIEISGCHMPGPLDRPLIRLQLPRHDTHEGGLSLAVRADQPDMLSLEEPERHIFKDCPVAKTVCQVFYVQNTHAAGVLS